MSAKFVVILVFGFCLTVISGERIRYDNYRVYNVTPQSNDHLEILKELEANSDSLIFLNGIQSVGKDVNVVVAPHKQDDFEQGLRQKGLLVDLLQVNLQEELDEEIQSRSNVATKDYNWSAYHTLDENYEWLKSLVKRYPKSLTLLVGGKSYEGRQILGVKLSNRAGNKAIFIEGGIHAREWISPATVTYVLNQLLTSKDSQVQSLANNFDWYFFPHVNPDGYVYTHKTNRLWRKTRAPYGSCYGADANRNWDFHWMETGASSSPCSDTYGGRTAFSEVETKSLSDYIRSVKSNIRLYISFHSYSQLLLFPYGHTPNHAPNHNHLNQISAAAVKALARRYKTQYTYGNVNQAIYPASGSSVDWVYGVLNVKLAFTYELRPRKTASTGFILPPSQIIPTGEETLDSLQALVQEAQKLGYFK